MQDTPLHVSRYQLWQMCGKIFQIKVFDLNPLFLEIKNSRLLEIE